jgi:hypothetical protein
MRIIHDSTIKHPHGIDITLYVVNGWNEYKRTTYRVKSQCIAEQFHAYYRQGRGYHRTALNILTRHSVSMV